MALGGRGRRTQNGIQPLVDTGQKTHHLGAGNLKIYRVRNMRKEKK
jgi:hypothetical protein